MFQHSLQDLRLVCLAPPGTRDCRLDVLGNIVWDSGWWGTSAGYAAGQQPLQGRP